MTHDSTTTTGEAPQPANVLVDGARIRRLRQEHGETITSLSAAVPVSFGHLAAIEVGRRRSIRPPLARALADALGVELDEIRAAS